MTSYAVGDIQGCLSCLERVLDKAGFDPKQDTLFAVGDLINRGPQSLETLKFCMSLGDKFKTVLGNHDLHLLAVGHGFRKPTPKDTLTEILEYARKLDLLSWLQQQPLLLFQGQYTLVHAGIPPQWSIEKALSHANEVTSALSSTSASSMFFKNMYGNTPDTWTDKLEGTDRLRCITNYLTRMRYCDEQGKLDLKCKLPPNQAPEGFLPWYSHKQRKARSNKIIFGHWAALEGQVEEDNIYPLDTGCVWGGRMRLMNLETGDYTHLSCRQ